MTECEWLRDWCGDTWDELPVASGVPTYEKAFAWGFAWVSKHEGLALVSLWLGQATAMDPDPEVQRVMKVSSYPNADAAVERLSEGFQ